MIVYVDLRRDRPGARFQVIELGLADRIEGSGEPIVFGRVVADPAFDLRCLRRSPRTITLACEDQDWQSDSTKDIAGLIVLK